MTKEEKNTVTIEKTDWYIKKVSRWCAVFACKPKIEKEVSELLTKLKLGKGTETKNVNMK